MKKDLTIKNYEYYADNNFRITISISGYDVDSLFAIDKKRLEKYIKTLLNKKVTSNKNQ